MYLCVVILVYLMIYDSVLVIDHVNLNYACYFHMIMFNYELWTNPQWSFG